MVGYSGTPLAAKLGIGTGRRALLDGAPAELSLGPLPVGAVVHRRAAAGSYDVVVLFAPAARRLERRWAVQEERITTAGRLWVAWPKAASGVPTDLTEGAVRSFGLERGLVDVKICAVDATWSALAFVRRLRDR